MRRYSWLVILFSFLGFAVGLAAHLFAYYHLLPPEIFLLYCRVEWLGVAFTAALVGWLMPTTAPRRQVLVLARWMMLACGVLVIYLIVYGDSYLRGEHPRRVTDGYAVVQEGRVVRTITPSEYDRLAAADAAHYLMALNRAFSLVWLLLFLGIGLHGIGYILHARRLGIREMSAEKYVAWWYTSG